LDREPALAAALFAVKQWARARTNNRMSANWAKKEREPLVVIPRCTAGRPLSHRGRPLSAVSWLSSGHCDYWHSDRRRYPAMPKANVAGSNVLSCGLRHSLLGWQAASIR